MTPPPEFNVDPKRDATGSIQGYVYQIYQSVLAWMQLRENEILVLEGSEDFDIHCGSSVTTTQVKSVIGNLTLRTQSVKDSINNYWACHERNPEFDIILRFLTTAEAGIEKGSPFGNDKKGLEYWQSAESEQIDIDPIRNFLLELDLDSNLVSFIETATDDELRDNLIRRIKWDMGNRPMECLQYIIEDKLKNHGLRLQINTHYSCQVLPHLLKKVADILSTKGHKELRFGDFLSSFDEATSVCVPRAQMEAMTSASDHIKSAEISRYENFSTSIGRPMPTVDGGISRTSVVTNLSDLLREQRLIFLVGSSGLGKTNLASLISHEISENWGWASFRGMQPAHIKDVLARAAYDMNSSRLEPFLVLDDVDLSKVALFEREFIALVFSIINADGMVVITGPTPPPLQLLPKLWKNESCEVTVPYFNESEVGEMICAHGLSDSKRVSDWTKTIWLTTSGHPQLVHARVRNLSTKGWPSIEISDLTKPEDVERVRSEARTRLVSELPNENARILAYRLSLSLGAFTRETAMTVAEVPPPTKLPGEAFDELIGPWIEREGENRYRVSPLLTGAAKDVLSERDIKAVHGAIALSILKRESIDQFEISTAFSHAFIVKHVPVLMRLAYTISTIEREKLYPLFDAMSLFTMTGLERGQRLLPENPSVDVMLRLVQYRLISSSPESDKAIAVIDRIEETLIQIEQPELKLYSEAYAYGMILNTIDVEIPPSKSIQMLSRMIDLFEGSDLKDINDSYEKGWGDLPRLGENKPAQVLFSLLAGRLSGLDDLAELVESLDTLTVEKRNQLLMICDSDIDFTTLLINRAWWKDVKNGVIDVNKALQVFDFTVTKSREWNVPELTKACLVAYSVIQDEYGHSTEHALETLDAADLEFPDDAGLINQRAKVLFNATRNSEALPIANKALTLPGLPEVEFIFCCRAAGTAAGEDNDWFEAERFFQLGASKAMSSDIQKSMGIGLIADAAFAAWKQKDHEKSLSLFSETLNLLDADPISEDIHNRYVHAAVRHCISWILFDARENSSHELVEPLPGMCSNQEPNEAIKDHRLVDISAAWEILAITENILGLELGIKERTQSSAGDEKLLTVEGYRRSVALDLIFKNKNIKDLIPILINFHEAVSYSKTLDKAGSDEYSTGVIPKLPDRYWENPDNWNIVCFNILVASVICISDDQSIPLPIDQWRNDLENFNALTNDVDQFLNALNGAPSNASLYQKTAAAIFTLRKGVLAPEDLWRCSFLLLNTFIDHKRWVEVALEELLIPRWIFSANNQRFAFKSPSFICPKIYECCVDDSLGGLPKIAAVLFISSQYLGISLTNDAEQMIKRIID